MHAYFPDGLSSDITVHVNDQISLQYKLSHLVSESAAIGVLWCRKGVQKCTPIGSTRSLKLQESWAGQCFVLPVDMGDFSEGDWARLYTCSIWSVHQAIWKNDNVNKMDTHSLHLCRLDRVKKLTEVKHWFNFNAFNMIRLTNMNNQFYCIQHVSFPALHIFWGSLHIDIARSRWKSMQAYSCEPREAALAINTLNQTW